MPFVYKEKDGLGFYEVSGWDGARGVFTTRRGGVSEGPFAQLNLGFGADRRASVEENRRLLARALGIRPGAVRTVRQVHGSDVFVHGRHGEDPPGEAGFDAAVTDVSGAAVCVLTADCVPILMYDKANGAVAAVHAGWAGTVSGVAGNAAGRMAEVFGTQASGLLAAIGPSIGPCCYEVDEKVAGRIKGPPGETAGLLHPTRPGHWMLDLWELNRRILIRSGLRPENISVMGLCTSCNQDRFFSHRKSAGNAGRMMALAMLA